MVSNQSCLTELPSKRQVKAPKMVTEELKEAPFLPYEPRGCQLDIIHDIRTYLDEGRHIVVESGTGTGKTIVSLAAALEHSKKRDKKIVYLVRTITQTDAVMKELRAVSKIHPVSGIALSGRGKSCPLFNSAPGFENIGSNVLSMLCEDRRTRSLKGQAGGCRFYDRTDLQMDTIERYWRSETPTSKMFDDFCEKLGACPYEAKKRLMKKSDVIAGAYVQILNPDIRESLMTNMDRQGDTRGITIIVDEAHNFLDAARDEESFIIDKMLVDNALDECSTFKGASVWEGVSIEAFIRHFKVCIRAAANEMLGFNKKSATIDEDPIRTKMMDKFGLSQADLDSALDYAIDLGEARTEKLIDSGDNRMSPIHELSILMKQWFSTASNRFVKTINAGDDGEYLRAACIDPKEVSKFFNSVPGTLHMSGTLQPLDQYARVLGLGGNPRFRTYPSPFPPENKLVIYDKTVTTKQDEMKADQTMQRRIEQKIVSLCDCVEKNTLVFFTSYNMMRMMRPYLETHITKPKYWEESGFQKRTNENLERFRQGRNGVFFSVIGGSVAEGIDFPGDELCFAILVGIPFPPPSEENKAMSKEYDTRYGSGKGWLYTSQVPAMRKMNQAIGRLIRTETDRGMAVILDNRMSRYASSVGAQPSDDPVGDAARFFSGR